MRVSVSVVVLWCALLTRLACGLADNVEQFLNWYVVINHGKELLFMLQMWDWCSYSVPSALKDASPPSTPTATASCPRTSSRSSATSSLSGPAMRSTTEPMTLIRMPFSKDLLRTPPRMMQGWMWISQGGQGWLEARGCHRGSKSGAVTDHRDAVISPYST